MALAKAICTCGACGKKFEVSVYKNNRKEADSFVNWAVENIDKCDECLAKERKQQMEEEAQKNIAEAAENGWPELTGSEKQIKWAVTIRANNIKSIAENIPKRKLGEFWKYVMEVMKEKTSAHWWIDNREYIRGRIMELIMEKQKSSVNEEISDIKETIAEPINKKHDGIVSIAVPDTGVQAKYYRDDEFINIVKSLGYRWDGTVWTMKKDVTTGTNEERAAELGSVLLNSGFAIKIQNPETLKNAIEGNYEPRTFRWITRIADENVFSIRWGKTDDLYEKAKSLPRAKYVSGCIEVPASEVDAILDFAKAYDFKFSKGAIEMIESVIKVNPAEVKKLQYKEENIKDVLESSREVIEDLKD